MNTIIIEHADKSTTELLKRLAERLGLSFKTKKEQPESGIVTNPELLKTIADYESGKVQPIEVDLDELKQKLLHA